MGNNPRIPSVDSLFSKEASWHLDEEKEHKSSI